MNSVPILLLLLIPAGGAIVGALLPSHRAAKMWALLVSLATAAVGLFIACGFDYHSGTVQFALKPSDTSWLYLPALGYELVERVPGERATHFMLRQRAGEERKEYTIYR